MPLFLCLGTLLRNETLSAYVVSQPNTLRLAAGCMVQAHIDQCRAIMGHGLIKRAAQVLGIVDIEPFAAKGLHHLLVAWSYGQNAGRKRFILREFLDTAANAAVVQDNDFDRAS